MEKNELSQEIFLDAPCVGEREKQYLGRAVDSGFVSSVGPFVPEFEERFARSLSAPRAVAVQSGTAALHLCLHELGIGPGDEVIVPALTFAATVNAVLYVGATPVIVDVDPLTWTMDPARAAEAVTGKTKAVIPVHLYGNPCDMSALLDLARDRELAVIEDATESLGALVAGRPSGTLGDMGCFSFNGNKTITTGGGGMVVGRDLQRLEHIKFLANQAKDPKVEGSHPEIGFNHRMTNIEAAMGLAQLEQLGEFLKKKAEFAKIYQRELKSASGVVFQAARQDSVSSFWLNAAVFEGADIVQFRRRLRERGVPVNRVFMPLTEFPYLKGSARYAVPVARSVYRQALTLPSSVRNSLEDTVKVARMIREECEGGR